MKFSEKVLDFYMKLDYTGSLPEGISIMNPYRDNPQILPLISSFYNKYYNDNKSRHLILGINPGRFGAGVTGLPFTDTKRLEKNCGLSVEGITTHETSSVFVYDMIDEYGGVYKFYSEYFISAISPLGYVSIKQGGKAVNYNYYDSKELTDTVYDFMIESLKKQLDFGIERDVCFCLGTGQNHKFLLAINENLKLFRTIIALEHPRYIMQYKLKQKTFYIKKYIEAFNMV
jgi:hypothetical protein